MAGGEKTPSSAHLNVGKAVRSSRFRAYTSPGSATGSEHDQFQVTVTQGWYASLMRVVATDAKYYYTRG